MRLVSNLASTRIARQPPSVDSGAWRTSFGARRASSSNSRTTCGQSCRRTPRSSTHTSISARTSTACSPTTANCCASSGTRVTRSFIFCLDEPDRHPGFRAAERPHARLRRAKRGESSRSPDSTCLTTRSLRRALPRPRRRRDQVAPTRPDFVFDDEPLEPVFELAAERRVPILIHGGRGLPPIADELARLMDAPRPQLIIAHAASPTWSRCAPFSGRPGAFFDTSVWSPLDLLDLLPARPTRADPLRLRLSLRDAAGSQPPRAARQAAGRATTGCGRCSAAARPASPRATRPWH